MLRLSTSEAHKVGLIALKWLMNREYEMLSKDQWNECLRYTHLKIVLIYRITKICRLEDMAKRTEREGRAARATDKSRRV